MILEAEHTVIRPQPGSQEKALSSSADITIFGGAAGVGKTYALLLEPLRHIDNGKFGAVCFRRESPQITAEGGLWDTSFDLYMDTGARPVQSPKLHWDFPSGARLTFSHLQYDKTVRDWDGSQITLLMFDELQHFTGQQFFYMLSRNRSMCGVTPYVRATCNPDPDSFLVDFLAWWIDQDTGYAIPERSGVIRYMVRENNVLHWGDTDAEMRERFLDSVPKSVTFVPGQLADNKILMETNPSYIGNLKALPEYERLRLLGGNWFARPSAGDLFKKQYFHMIERENVPEQKLFMRYWDRAATIPSDINPDPDWTAGGLMSVDKDGKYYIWEMEHDRQAPLGVEQMVMSTAERDTAEVVIGLEQEPGASGKMEVDYYIRLLSGYPVEAFPKTKSKLTCWKPLSAQAKNGNVYVVRGPWNNAFFNV